jgi:acyl carrier protein
MQNVNQSIEDRVLSLIRSIIERDTSAADFGPESRLVDIGLSSMDMVALMLKVEAEFDFTIPQIQISPENFQSVRSLERMIVTELGREMDRANGVGMSVAGQTASAL